MAATNKMCAWIHKNRNLPLEEGMELMEKHPRPSESLKPWEILIQVKYMDVNLADPLFAEMTWPAKATTKQISLPDTDFSREVMLTRDIIISKHSGDRVLAELIHLKAYLAPWLSLQKLESQ